MFEALPFPRRGAALLAELAIVVEMAVLAEDTLVGGGGIELLGPLVGLGMAAGVVLLEHVGAGAVGVVGVGVVSRVGVGVVARPSSRC